MSRSGTPIDATVVQPARRYNYLLGGKDNFEADRASAEAILRIMPSARMSAKANRDVLHRAVRFLAAQGIRQYLDIGTGIPMSPNTHEIAQRVDPTARVVYVDNDPIVLAHARALMLSSPQGRTAYLDRDLREPQSILAAPELRSVLDLTEPVGLLLVAILHFIRDDENPRQIIGALLDALPAGSFVVVTHSTFEYMTPAQIEQLDAVREPQTQLRSGAELAELFRRPGLDLISPGVAGDEAGSAVQSVVRWWPDAAETRPAVEDVACNALVGRLSS